MAFNPEEEKEERTEEEKKRKSGRPGGGKGRVEEVGPTGVWPASGPPAPSDAEAHGMAAWGQGERGAAGYDDSGRSEVWFYEQELEDLEEGEEIPDEEEEDR